MKRVILIIFIIVVVCIIGSIYLIFNNQNDIDKYYTVTYTATYNTFHIVTGNNYEIVKNEQRLEEILQKINNEEHKNIFNKTYFNNKDLLVIEAGIDTEIKNMYISNNKVDVLIYCASPLTTADTEFEFNIYLIPIEKNLTNINVVTTVYPDRLY